MTISGDPHTWIGAPVHNQQGDALGHIDGVYFHEVTGKATWAAVTDGAGVAVAPLDQAEIDGHALCLPYRVDQLSSAPQVAPGHYLDPHLERDLYRHYGLAPAAADMPTRVDHRDTGERDPIEMVRSEEQLRTGVERRVYGRVRLVTYIVTEDVTFTVPVSRQEVRLEQIPLDETGYDSGAPVGELVEDVHEVVLYGEQVVFTTTTVPVERVRLIRRIVKDSQPVTAELRAEQIDIERIDSPVDAERDAPTHPRR